MCVWPGDEALWGPDRLNKTLPAGCWCRRSKILLNMTDVCPGTKSAAAHLQIHEQKHTVTILRLTRHIMKHNVSLIQAKHFLTYSEQWFTPSKSCIYTVVFYNPIFLLPNVWKQNHRYISRCIHQVCVIIMHAVWWELFMTRADAACARTMIPLL